MVIEFTSDTLCIFFIIYFLSFSIYLGGVTSQRSGAGTHATLDYFRRHETNLPLDYFRRLKQSCRPFTHRRRAHIPCTAFCTCGSIIRSYDCANNMIKRKTARSGRCKEVIKVDCQNKKEEIKNTAVCRRLEISRKSKKKKKI